jgi:hypothetical protein
MDDAETAELLAMIAALDPYGEKIPVDDNQVDAWALALGDVDPNFAKRAAIEHYRTTGKRISIADVIEGARAVEARDRAELRAGQLRIRHQADLAALPAPAETRDRTRDIAALLAEHRNWDPIGDLGTRRRQAAWSPELAQAYAKARRAKRSQERIDGE